MKRRLIQLSLCIGLTSFSQLNAQSILFPPSINNPLATPMPNSVIYNGDNSSIGGYVRGNAWGAGKDFDYANLFGEVGIQGEATKGFTEGYGYLKAEVRMRDGEFFGDNETQTELRDLYVGYKNERIDVTLGNQNVQWGRGFTSQPTNNISPTNGFIYTTDGADQKMYNFMLRSKLYINENLEWEVIGIPVYKMSYARVDLLDIPVGVGENVVPEKSFSNGSFATKLNLNGGPLGMSISYFNGYDVTPGVNTGVDEDYNAFAFSDPFKKQTFGADFMWRFRGHSNGNNAEPTNDLLFSLEAAYNDVDNPDDAYHIPYSDLEFSAGLIKTFWNNTKLDSFTAILGYDGRIVSDYTENIEPTDPTSPTYGLDMAHYIQRSIAEGMFGQYDSYVHSLTGVFIKTFQNKKFTFSTVLNYGLNKQAGEKVDGSHHSFLIYPNITWKVTDQLIAQGGYFKLEGPGTNVITPVRNGASLSLKYNFRLR